MLEAVVEVEVEVIVKNKVWLSQAILIPHISFSLEEGLLIRNGKISPHPKDVKFKGNVKNMQLHALWQQGGERQTIKILMTYQQ
jgi:predicted Zn-dependent protease